MSKVAVIGAGIIGLTTAVAIQEKLGPTTSVTIFTENVSPNTTGDVSAGLWTPYLMKDTPEDKIIKWSGATLNYLKELWRNGYAEKAGISLNHLIEVRCDKNFQIPSWSNMPFGYSGLAEPYLEKLRKQHKKPYSAGIHYVTFVCEPTKFLPLVEQSFLKNGGTLVRRKVNDFKELANDFDIIVNCTGLQAKELTGDDSVKPIRGQIARVVAPWQFQTIMTDDNYIIPNQKYLILGGTKQENNYNTEVDYTDKEHILQGCYSLVPGLKHAPIYKHMVGLRPGRPKVRLELETYTINNKTVDIVHNYGHGGCGVTLFFGCAGDAAELVEFALTNYKSKL